MSKAGEQPRPAAAGSRKHGYSEFHSRVTLTASPRSILIIFFIARFCLSSAIRPIFPSKPISQIFFSPPLMAELGDRASFLAEGRTPPEEDDAFEFDGCCGLFPCFRGLRRRGGQEQRSLLEGEERGDPWWVKGARRAKEASELVAGPRWKTFLRRVTNNIRKGRSQFQYDPQSYALNFDGGELEEEEDRGYPDFSARFAMPLGKNASSLQSVHQ